MTDLYWMEDIEIRAEIERILAVIRRSETNPLLDVIYNKHASRGIFWYLRESEREISTLTEKEKAWLMCLLTVQ